MNTYQKPAQLVIADSPKYDTIQSEEGCTQGDVTASNFYAIGLRPLINTLGDTVDPRLCKQSWYADDSSVAGELKEMLKWWNKLCEEGPKYGYFPLASKTILITKEVFEDEAHEVFARSGIQISTTGVRHMGAVIGSECYKEEYVSKKVEKWIQDIEQLAQIAKDEPQAVLSSYTKAVSHRWTYVQRTIPNTKHLFAPLENAIRDKLIPSIVGRSVSDIERRIFALPVRMGGLGLTDPSKAADLEFNASMTITANLTRIIRAQDKDLTNYNLAEVTNNIKAVKEHKEGNLKTELEEIMQIADPKTRRVLTLEQEKGSGSWLLVPPIKSLGYTLNKREFQDSIYLRYDWNIPDTPSYCQCGSKNDINHALCCKKGGYVIMRHNRIRDVEAEIMKEVCKDVRTEPELIPITNTEHHNNNGNNTDKARLDVAAVGVWGPLERTFLDIRIMHPNAPSYADKDIKQLYSTHEREKKRAYNERVLQIEKGSFTPIVMSTFGGMGEEAIKFHKRLATLIAEKRHESYPEVLNYIRTRLRFSLLKSVLIAIRGIRGKQTVERTTPISSLSFNLLPTQHTT